MADPLHTISFELWPGTTGPGFTIYTIANSAGSTIGYTVVTGPSNITVTTGGQSYTWKSNRSYWFSTNGTNYFNSTFVMTAWTFAQNGATSFEDSTLTNFTANYYKPNQAFAVYINQIPTIRFYNYTNFVVEYTIKNSAGTTMGYLNATNSQLAWYFIDGGLAAFQSAQQSFQPITYTHGNVTLSTSLCPVIDSATTP